MRPTPSTSSKTALIPVLASVAALAVASPARAGGIGLLLDGGFHTDRVYYYSENEIGTGGTVVPLTDQTLWPQYHLDTLIGHGGGGAELVLGDRDDRINGVFRFYYIGDLPEVDPKTLSTDKLDANIQPDETVHSTVRDNIRSIGMGSVGLSWGIFGNPDTWQVGFSARLGSGFLTYDHTEFLQSNIGPMATYKVARQVQLFGDLTYQTRWHKVFTHGADAAVGVRYLFD